MSNRKKIVAGLTALGILVTIALTANDKNDQAFIAGVLTLLYLVYAYWLATYLDNNSKRE